MGRCVSLAQEQGLSATRVLSAAEQKRLGQFMTPCGIAEAMAQRACSLLELDRVRILEPAAGAGVLAAASVEALLSRPTPPSEISLTLFEIDKRLIPGLRKLSGQLRELGRARGIRISISIENEDFLLSELATNRAEQFDLVIANPPYFKLNKSAPQAVAHAYAVYGQPNIYGLFMAATAQLLAPGGRWCFITPRSWTNGAYFASMRRHLFAWLRLDAMHVFESREAHFTDDEILQEAMITWATAQAVDMPEIVFSTSAGLHDLASADLRSVPASKVMGGSTGCMITLPVNEHDHQMHCTGTLATLGLKVSTGPVVAFRAKDYLSEKGTHDTVPLLWMQHVSRHRISWPRQKKLEHIKSCMATAAMLVPNKPMVLLRRFSPKEDIRRVTAAPYLGELPGIQIGLENHLNYIYRPGGELSPAEVLGISAYLNSRRVDAYFRSTAGSTQVNATETRMLPMPTMAELTMIGNRCDVGMSLASMDFVVDDVLGRKEIAA